MASQTDVDPPKKGWLRAYERFLLKNASQISSIESSVRSLTLILPGRYQDVEIASEACKLPRRDELTSLGGGVAVLLMAAKKIGF